jgi:hypothetical protein
LIVLQASGSTNWMVGLIRRVQHVSDQEIRVGIETLSRRIAALEARTPAATSANTKILPGIPALWLQDDNPKLPIRFVFPSETFNPTEQLEFDYNGRRVALTPVKLLERGSDYDLATYKAAISAT